MSTKWGIISTAHINRLVLAGARESDQVDVVAVASRDQARAEAYAREHGIERAHGSYEALLEDPDVDAVYISLPNSLHVEWSIRALEAGKHVLCEKPLDRRPEEVERAFDAADRAGRILMEAFMYRHNPQTAKLRELVDGGRDRRRSGSSARPSASAWATPENVRLAADLDGGALMDVGCYCVSGSRLLGGEPEQVYGRAARRRERRGRPLRGGRCASPATSSRTSTAASSCPTATSSRWSAPRARSSSTTRGTRARR